jgi:predicted metalloprotease with PDZ domain
MGVSLRPAPEGGVSVSEVAPGSPALAAGIKAGDVILSVNERPPVEVFFGGGFRAMYGGKPAGTPIPIQLKRDGAPLTIQVPLRFGAAAPRIVEDSAAAPRARRLRNGRLRGTSDRLRRVGEKHEGPRASLAAHRACRVRSVLRDVVHPGIR